MLSLPHPQKVGNIAMWFFCFVLFLFIETGFLCVTILDVMEIDLVDQAGLNSQRSACLCLPSGGIKGVCHHRSVLCGSNGTI